MASPRARKAARPKPPAKKSADGRKAPASTKRSGKPPAKPAAARKAQAATEPKPPSPDPLPPREAVLPPAPPLPPPATRPRAREAHAPAAASVAPPSPPPWPPKAAEPEARGGSRAFDPGTGAWLPEPSQPPAAAGPAPDAPKKGTAGYVLCTVLLWMDLVLLGLSTLASIVFGIILVFDPDSPSADWIRERLASGDSASLVSNTLLTFVAFGVIPLIWVLGTRVRPIEGTKRFLRLHDPGRSIARGVLLAIPMLAGVALLIGLYSLVAERLGLPGPEDEANPAVQAILDNLTWPIAALVALCAGIGEEIFFRGFLQRYAGVWGQAVLFGLAHATGGYLPQIAFALLLGVAFGLLMRRGWSLWSLITAHVLYDFTLLALALAAPELG